MNFDIEDAIDDLLVDLEVEIDGLLISTRSKLLDWAAAVARDKMSLDEFKELLEGEKALSEMTVLQKKVETTVLLNTLKGNLIDTLIEVVKKAVRIRHYNAL